MTRLRLASRWALALLFIGAGILHFLVTDFYASIVPPWLPEPRLLVLISGVFEILGGVGILIPRTRLVAGWGLLLLLIAVWPANMQMVWDARTEDAERLEELLLWLRLPLQLLIMFWVWRVAGLKRPRTI